MLSLFALTACITLPTARQVYRFDPGFDPSELAFTTADTLGFSPELTDGGFTLTNLPEARLGGKPIVVTTAPGTLTLDGPRLSIFADADAFGPSTRVLVATMHDEFEEKPTSPKLAPRSEALVVTLDILAPWAGALYTTPGNPYAVNLGIRFFGRLGVDLLGAALLLEPTVFPRTSPFIQILSLATGVFELAFSRVFSTIDDVTMLPFRNAFARSGFALPEPLPEAESTTFPSPVP